jgi:enamine deaminase RidA (YjgF/YER057c/UK114 family)
VLPQAAVHPRQELLHCEVNPDVTSRRSIEVEGLSHSHPIPNASRIGRFVATGTIFGKDPARNGEFAEGPEAQCALMFANIRRVIQAAGGSPEHILKLEVWVRDPACRALVNRYWLEMFPDPHARPARHTFIDPNLPGAALVQCAFLAVLDTD